MGERDFLSHGALSGAVSWALARLARIESPCTILDPCVGRGGLLIEAALSHPRCDLLWTAVFLPLWNDAEQGI
eukprot:980088-Rhodomonas_salina.1